MKPRYLFPSDYMADPSANVFNGRLYIYPSHDWDAGECFDDDGGHFQMKDYHVLSFDDVEHDEATDHGIILDVKDVPWAEKQMWDNDVVEKDGRYYLIFSAKGYDGVFHLGVAVSDRPEGPFKAEPQPIRGSFSIDPCAFKDDDGEIYVYFGGLWGGQLQWWRPLPDGSAPIIGKYGEIPTLADDKSVNGKSVNGKCVNGKSVNGKSEDGKSVNGKSVNGKCIDLGAAPDHKGELYTTADTPAIPSCVVRMSGDVMQFAEAPRPVVIIDKDGQPLSAGDPHRFFEASWMYKYKDTYYFSYSTGDSHLLCYATSHSPYGPFRYQGVILDPVVGWTTHHSIVEYRGQWYLFYHDCVPSNDITHLRSLKVQRLYYNADGTIQKVINE